MEIISPEQANCIDLRHKLSDNATGTLGTQEATVVRTKLHLSSSGSAGLVNECVADLAKGM